MNKIIALKDEYDALVERLIKADEVMNNLFTLQEKGELKHSIDFYVESYQKLMYIMSRKITEIEEAIGRRMTLDERLEGFNRGCNFE